MDKTLWDFSVELYARPDVADACLQLQDDCGVDVCLLLVALWLERRGVCATAARAAQLARLAAPWQAAVTVPLRQLRRAWKPLAQDNAELAELRRQLAALELQAERLLLQRLAALSEDWPHDAQGASDWLAHLPAPHSAEWNPADRAALQRLRDAAATQS